MNTPRDDRSEPLKNYRAHLKATLTPERWARFEQARENCATQGCHGMCGRGCRLL